MQFLLNWRGHHIGGFWHGLRYTGSVSITLSVALKCFEVAVRYNFKGKNAIYTCKNMSVTQCLDHKYIIQYHNNVIYNILYICVVQTSTFRILVVSRLFVIPRRTSYGWCVETLEVPFLYYPPTMSIPVQYIQVRDFRHRFSLIKLQFLE